MPNYLITVKEVNFLILVGKDEISYLREHIGKELEVTRTMRQRSNRHRYYIAETRLALAALERYKSEKSIEHYE